MKKEEQTDGRSMITDLEKDNVMRTNGPAAFAACSSTAPYGTKYQQQDRKEAEYRFLLFMP
jgi:hypothetical protein